MMNLIPTAVLAAAKTNLFVAVVSIAGFSFNGATNTTTLVTNADFVAERIVYTSSTVGPQYAISFPSGFELSEVQNWTPEIASYIETTGGVSTVWMANGIARFSVSGLTDAESEYRASLALNCNAVTNGGGTFSNFNHFFTNSFAYASWTNFVALTNGKANTLWATYSWTNYPNGTPSLAWNTNCIAYGLTGHTAISQANTFQSSRGQIPVTALTRRHGYARGHGMAAPITNSLAGHTVFFCTASNTLVAATITNSISLHFGTNDFTVMAFTADLPDSITPLRAVTQSDTLVHYPITGIKPRLTLTTEQSGHISVNSNDGKLTGFEYPYFKGGDSGSPNLYLHGSELLFSHGTTSSGISDYMQAVMNALVVALGLDTNSYQIAHYEFDGYPTY